MISLSDAIEALRSELSRSVELGKSADLRFELGEVTIQLEAIAEESTSVEGKVNWWIFAGGVKGQDKDKSKHLLTVNLKPIDVHGQPLKVRAQRENPAE